jgi:hypothetical protein
MIILWLTNLSFGFFFLGCNEFLGQVNNTDHPIFVMEKYRFLSGKKLIFKCYLDGFRFRKFNICFNIILTHTSLSPNWVFPFMFADQDFLFIFLPVHGTCPSHLTVFNLGALILFDEQS